MIELFLAHTPIVDSYNYDLVFKGIYKAYYNCNHVLGAEKIWKSVADFKDDSSYRDFRGVKTIKILEIHP